MALGCWLETRSLTLGQMRCVEALAGDCGHGLFAEEVLAADGWRRDAHGHWHGPLSPAAVAGPVDDVVVLAQARADVEQRLAPSFEQTFTGGELVALEEPDDQVAVEPPEDAGDAERVAATRAAMAPSTHSQGTVAPPNAGPGPRECEARGENTVGGVASLMRSASRAESSLSRAAARASRSRQTSS